MFLGPVRLSDTVNYVIQSRAITLAPLAADSPPTYRVYDGTTLLLTGASTAFDSGTLTGAYLARIAATTGNGFARGRTYTVVALWTISGGDRQEVATFIVT